MLISYECDQKKSCKGHIGKGNHITHAYFAVLPVSRRELHFWDGILKQSTKMHSAEALLRNIPTRGRGRGSPAEEFHRHLWIIIIMLTIQNHYYDHYHISKI